MKKKLYDKEKDYIYMYVYIYILAIYIYIYIFFFFFPQLLVAQMVKNLPAMQETQV